MNSFLIRFLIIIFIFLGSHSYSQFTYVELGFNNTNVLYGNTSSSGSRTDYHNFSLRVSAITRFIRNFGIGAELNIPLVQGNSFSFYKAYTPDGSYFSNSDFTGGTYSAQEYDYSFRNSISGSLFGRIYLSTVLNPYIDVKMSYLNMTEKFIFQREEIEPYYNYDWVYGTDAVNINYEKKHQLIIPGVAIGLQPHLSKHLFMNVSFGMDFYTFKDKGFAYPIVHNWSTVHDKNEIVIIESKARNTKAGILINLGVGYFF